MNAAILSIGTELVTGQTVDTNSAWVAQRLSALGVDVIRHVTVGDDLQRIATSLRHALSAADLVIVTGGLGPTADDLTRAALSAAVDAPLEENAEALAQIVAFFQRWQRPMAESNRLQALIPRGCKVIVNPRGTAPGIWYQVSDKHLFALPGVPSEMRVMYEAAVEPVIREGGGGACTLNARLLTFGMSESKLGEVISDLMARGRNPLVGTTASQAIISVRIIAHGRDAAEVRRRLDADVLEIRRRLGEAVFGADDDTLQGVAAKLLTERRLTVATAESCTGGLLAKRLTDVPGSSVYFLRGYVTYTLESKIELLGVPAEIIESQGSVSEAAAHAMACECRKRAGSDLAISITGIAGPSGGSPPEKPVGLVYVGLADARGVEVKRLLLGEHLTRGEIRDRTCKSALNLVRLRLLKGDSFSR